MKKLNEPAYEKIAMQIQLVEKLLFNFFITTAKFM